MSEADIWQIIQTGNEISVMRTEVFISITVGVLIISSIRAIELTKFLLGVLLGMYFVFGFINFAMLIGEMEILLRGMELLRSMRDSSQELSPMGLLLAEAVGKPFNLAMIPLLNGTYWVVSLGTASYAIWQYTQQKTHSNLDIRDDRASNVD